jgi:hypothetical protein
VQTRDGDNNKKQPSANRISNRSDYNKAVEGRLSVALDRSSDHLNRKRGDPDTVESMEEPKAVIEGEEALGSTSLKF